jgi:hypothetical protein
MDSVENGLIWRETQQQNKNTLLTTARTIESRLNAKATKSENFGNVYDSENFHLSLPKDKHEQGVERSLEGKIKKIGDNFSLTGSG